MANKTNKPNKTDAPKNKRDFTQVKGIFMLRLPCGCYVNSPRDLLNKGE